MAFSFQAPDHEVVDYATGLEDVCYGALSGMLEGDAPGVFFLVLVSSCIGCGEMMLV